MRKQPVVRFAPSPTGFLHLGHALSALFAFRAAEAMGARFLVRMEDIDQGRCRPDFVAQILDDLAWLGLSWEEPVRVQSEHMDAYGSALRRLDEMGVLYACGLTRREIADTVHDFESAGAPFPRDPDGSPLLPLPARIPRSGEANITGRTALRLGNETARTLIDRPLTFRELGPDQPTGLLVAEPEKWGDVVLARKDIGTSYHLSVVVDDALQGVTHVTRGTDLFEATHLHRLLQHLLGLPAPVYVHHPLITDREGRKLSKSHHAKSLKVLREEGRTADQVRRDTGISKFDGYFETLSGQEDAAPPGTGPSGAGEPEQRR